MTVPTNPATTWHAPWCDPHQHDVNARSLVDEVPGCIGRLLHAGEGQIGGWWTEQGFIVDTEPSDLRRWQDQGMTQDDLRSVIALLQQALNERP